MAIESLSSPEFVWETHDVKRSGPLFLRKVLERFRAANETRDRQCRADPTSSEDCVHVERSDLLDGIDHSQMDNFINTCQRKPSSQRLRQRCSDLFTQMRAGATHMSSLEVNIFNNFYVDCSMRVVHSTCTCTVQLVVQLNGLNVQYCTKYKLRLYASTSQADIEILKFLD